jgi:hypothetical protein
MCPMKAWARTKKPNTRSEKHRSNYPICATSAFGWSFPAKQALQPNQVCSSGCACATASLPLKGESEEKTKWRT